MKLIPTLKYIATNLAGGMLQAAGQKIGEAVGQRIGQRIHPEPKKPEEKTDGK